MCCGIQLPNRRPGIAAIGCGAERIPAAPSCTTGSSAHQSPRTQPRRIAKMHPSAGSSMAGRGRAYPLRQSVLHRVWYGQRGKFQMAGLRGVESSDPAQNRKAPENRPLGGPGASKSERILPAYAPPYRKSYNWGSVLLPARKLAEVKSSTRSGSSASPSRILF